MILASIETAASHFCPKKKQKIPCNCLLCQTLGNNRLDHLEPENKLVWNKIDEIYKKLIKLEPWNQLENIVLTITNFVVRDRNIRFIIDMKLIKIKRFTLGLLFCPSCPVYHRLNLSGHNNK